MLSKTFRVRTKSREEITIITAEAEAALRDLGVDEGLCTLFTPHTTCALSINESADPDVLSDLTRAFKAMIPEVRFDHGEGNSDAHLLSTMIGVSVTIPFSGGRFILGRWQGLYFIELDGPREREVRVYVG
ncbi:MAG TPA: secondary thiamine-phosphate synthase enzyme YjbQ [Thermoanaerobaculia bacterium]|nr:secondary thiamine-phosphate synthase enzyme YjbQ [Thermoanaerobaculia bacterium]